ncbi:MAG: alanine dehydrogenase [Rubrobacteraceae bacterium]
MRLGIPRERAPGESRVALSPHAVAELTRVGHRVLVEKAAGEPSSISDEEYVQAGAKIVAETSDVYAESELVAKVQGPSPEEYEYLREGLTVMAFLSLPINETLMRAMLDSRCVAFAMESIRDEKGQLPILLPMSEIAGSLVPQIGAHYLQRNSGGRGILLGSVAGVRPGRVVILGCGIVGSNAARVASGLGAEVIVFDRDLDRLRRLEQDRLSNVTTLAASDMAIRNAALHADLLIGAVYQSGTKTPSLVERATVEQMKDGSVIVDVDVDYGGCVETSRPTTLQDPVFVEAGVVHYCVKNVPASVPVTATRALSNALLPLVREISGSGLADALNANTGLQQGVAVAEGRILDHKLARSTGTEHSSVSSVLPLHEESR